MYETQSASRLYVICKFFSTYDVPIFATKMLTITQYSAPIFQALDLNRIYFIAFGKENLLCKYSECLFGFHIGNKDNFQVLLLAQKWKLAMCYYWNARA